MEYRIKFHAKRNNGTYEAFQIKLKGANKFISFSKKESDVTIPEDRFKALSSNERFKTLFDLDVIEVFKNDSGKAVKMTELSNANGIPEVEKAEEEIEEEIAEEETEEEETTTTRATRRRTTK